MSTQHFVAAICLAPLAGTIAWAQPVPSKEPSGTHIFPAEGHHGQ